MRVFDADLFEHRDFLQNVGARHRLALSRRATLARLSVCPVPQQHDDRRGERLVELARQSSHVGARVRAVAQIEREKDERFVEIAVGLRGE